MGRPREDYQSGHILHSSWPPRMLNHASPQAERYEEPLTTCMLLFCMQGQCKQPMASGTRHTQYRPVYHFPVHCANGGFCSFVHSFFFFLSFSSSSLGRGTLLRAYHWIGTPHLGAFSSFGARPIYWLFLAFAFAFPFALAFAFASSLVALTATFSIPGFICKAKRNQNTSGIGSIQRRRSSCLTALPPTWDSMNLQLDKALHQLRVCTYEFVLPVGSWIAKETSHRERWRKPDVFDLGLGPCVSASCIEVLWFIFPCHPASTLSTFLPWGWRSIWFGIFPFYHI